MTEIHAILDSGKDPGSLPLQSSSVPPGGHCPSIPQREGSALRVGDGGPIQPSSRWTTSCSAQKKKRKRKVSIAIYP